VFGRATGAARRCPPLEAPTGHWRQAGLLVAVERHSPICDVPCPGHLCTECGCGNGVGRHTERLPQRLTRAASRRTARRLRACLGSLLAGGGWPASCLAEGRWCDGACDQPEGGGVGRLDGACLLRPLHRVVLRDGRGLRSCGGVSSRRVTRDRPAGHVPRRVTSPVSVLLSAVERAARRSVRDCRCRGARVAPIAGLERSSVGCRPPPPVSPMGADSLSRRSGCGVNPYRARLEVRLDVVVAATLPIYRRPIPGRLCRALRSCFRHHTTGGSSSRRRHDWETVVMSDRTPGASEI